MRTVRKKQTKTSLASILVLLFVVSIYMLSSCQDKTLLDYGPGLSPQRLLSDNDFVALCTLLSCDTVASLGRIEHWLDTSEYILLRYNYTPTIVLLDKVKCDAIRLWCLASQGTHSKEVRSALGNTGNGEELIYGKRISSTDDIPRISYTLLGMGSFASPKIDIDTLKDRRARINFIRDTIIVSRLLDSMVVHAIMNAVGTDPAVCHLYGTEFQFETHFEFSLGHVGFRSEGSVLDRSVSSEEYIQLVKEQAKISQ